MKFSMLTATAIVVSLSSVVFAHDRFLDTNKRHAAYRARQNLALSPSGSSSSSSSSTSSSFSASSTIPVPSPTTPTGTLDGNAIPPLAQITSGMAIQGTVNMFTTFSAGASAPISGAPPLPSINIVVTNYPQLDVIPPTNSSLVQGWIAKIANANIPNLPKTTDGSCASDPQLVANASASGSCWWTCGGCLRDTDISVCPNKGTWGVSYDDGPSPYTPHLINYLNQKQLKATFFVVGSRVISRPDMLQTEYMLGHELSVHTWSHPPLTSLTNEQIVAELAWTMKAIKDVTGVTPNTFRPPYGDLDDRVRAVAAAMGLRPIQWTGSGENEFDTEDWKIPGGTATGLSSYAAFQKILGLQSSLNTGFIVLEHDLYQQTVDMAIGYFLPLAFNQSLTLDSINVCLGNPLSNSYIETYSNTTTTNGTHTTGTSRPTSSATQGGQSNPSNAASLNIPRGASVSFGLMAVGALLLG